MDYAFAIFDGEKNTYEDWGLMLQDVAIQLPAAQIISVDVPGANGVLDLSEVLTGFINYGSRPATLTFNAMNSYDDWPALISTISNYLHGKKRSMVLDNDPGFYYYGRFAVSTAKSDEATTTVVITGTVDPYKYETEQQEISLAVSGSAEANLQGSRMPAVPTITSTAAMAVTFNGTDYSLDVGDNKIPDICLIEGENTLLFTGTGTVTIVYRRGEF